MLHDAPSAAGPSAPVDAPVLPLRRSSSFDRVRARVRSSLSFSRRNRADSGANGSARAEVDGVRIVTDGDATAGLIAASPSADAGDSAVAPAKPQRRVRSLSFGSRFDRRRKAHRVDEPTRNDAPSSVDAPMAAAPVEDDGVRRPQPQPRARRASSFSLRLQRRRKLRDTQAGMQRADGDDAAAAREAEGTSAVQDLAPAPPPRPVVRDVRMPCAMQGCGKVRQWGRNPLMCVDSFV